MLWSVITLLTIAGCCAYALRWGGLDERLAAIGGLLAVVASNIVTDGAYTHTEGGVLVVDVALFIGLLVLALRSDRFWPMYAAAFQLVGTMFHFASMVQTGDFAWAYYIALIFWTFPVFIALAAGTWFEGRYRRR
ncbi:hypothetical protein [Polymorphobacter fuscus]|uniref:Uncharacterized protein n=1 Tax=Sandarakinorhabdus fusca TaxID=1439888 RepID=A0A7C9GQJ3_9SPHN|nr:hypothetical protein [Polymorphobacter fuscus]KAB7648904.1 hypothetical protein F9290_04365 [Polymorphobacter fuscus]MQT16491.1 hypothetical protein [Polymorphobacter fuscus]NJC07219.1 hypothetical protein [Polymorphobacter fuscus]